MTDAETIEEYNRRVSDCVGKYELLKFEDLHSDILDLIPTQPGVILDIGAGSGRDSAWFAKKGWDVVAIDPASKMLAEARARHSDAQIRWVGDGLPGLEKTYQLGLSYDLIWISAVWMHLPPDSRMRAFRKMVSLLRPSGWIMISLRHGSFSDGRKSYDVSREEIDKLARLHGLAVRRVCKSSDRFNRTGVSWEWVCLRLPDDGTEALPLLRHTIFTDSKSSTYKLALIRVLIRIADGAIGVSRDVDEDTISIPLGLVALYWIRMYKPLIESGIPQAPLSVKSTGLGFVKSEFQDLKEYSAFDLRIGQRFSGGNARSLIEVLIAARDTIRSMPAFYIKYPNSSEQVFKASSAGRIVKSDSFVLNSDLLWSLGELKVPRYIWMAMCRFASWIEPALIGEWIRLMQDYSAKNGQLHSYDELMAKLQWIDPERDTNLVRGISSKMLASDNPVFCVWSGKKLQESNIDIDHCFPFSAWPCGDLWNLLPTHRTINQREKGDKLVTAETLSSAAELISDWWNRAYVIIENSVWADRFYNEAEVSLPISGMLRDNEQVLNGMLLKRIALKRDLQITDWTR